MVSSYKSKLPYGLRDKKLIHISEILPTESGLNCNCICPSCGITLQAKLPKTKVDFTARFAHHNADTCKYATETAIHMKAKEIIDAAKHIVLPEVAVCYKGLERLVYKNTKITFDHVELEYRIDDIIPDVVAYKNDKSLLIEIKVTHGIDDVKLQKIKRIGMSTIEIDLSDMDDNFDPEILYEEIITKTDRKTWVYNTRQEKAHKELIKEYEANKEKQKRIEENIQKMEKQKRAVKIQNLTKITEERYQQEMRKKWANDFSDNPIWKRYSGLLKISKDNIPVYLNIEIPGDFVFGCDRRVWQTYIFQRFIYNKVKKYKEETYEIGPKWIIQNIKKNLKSYLISDLIYLKDISEFKDIPDLTDVVYLYLKKIEEYGYLCENTSGHIYYSRFEILDPDSVYKEIRMIPNNIPEYDIIADFFEKRDWNACKEYITELLIKYYRLNNDEFTKALGLLFNGIVGK